MGEAISSLDIKNEKFIRTTRLPLQEKVSVVIIAHWLSTIDGCDSVIWLDKGRVRKWGRARDFFLEYIATLRSNKEVTFSERL